MIILWNGFIVISEMINLVNEMRSIPFWFIAPGIKLIDNVKRDVIDCFGV